MGVETKTFRRKLLATSISSCLLATASSAFAQSDEPTVVEEVQVFGIRASVQASMDIKRDSTGVVDAISAEDIGKMPDSNLAESLQRIAGVSIDRTNGEGSKVTVRGIDPNMNMVTLNGRVMPTVTNDGTAGDKSSRAFDFANIASESVSGVEVYKTGRAQQAGGGLGATIDLKTIRPLDVGGTKASFGAKALHDTTVGRGEGQEVTPELSGLLSWANDDENFGVSLSASYQERDNVRSNAFVNNWQLKTRGAATAPIPATADSDGDPFGTVDGTIPAQYYIDHDNDPSTDPILTDTDIQNLPEVGGLYALPTDLRYALEDNHRERTNAQLTMQFRPVDSITATLDYTYAANDLSAARHQQSTWYNVSAITALQFDTGNAVATPLVYQETYDGSKDLSFAQQQFQSDSQTNSFGANLAWDITDAFTMQVDYHNSVATNKTDQYELGLNANVVTGNYSNWSTDFPVMGATFDDSDLTNGNGNGVLDGADMSGAMGTLAVDSQRAEIQQFRLMGDVELDEFIFFDETKFSFGLDSRSQKNITMVNKGETPRITMGNWGGVNPSSFGNDWPNYFSGRNFADGFDQSDATGNANFLDFGLDGDFDAIKQALEYANAQAQTATKVIDDDPATTDTVEYYWVDGAGNPTDINPDNFNNFPGGKVKPNGHVDVNRTIDETVNAFYVAFHGGFDIAGMAAHIGLGLRYEETDLTSEAIAAVPADLQWDGDNDWSIVPGVGALATQSLSEENSYDNLLPNIDFDLSITDNLIARLSYSTTMARPSFSNLKADTSIDDIYTYRASTGQPQLEALESDNIDVSVEWYYTEDSYISAAYFMKDVSNFIGTEVIDSTVYDLRDARNGERYNDAVAGGINPNNEAALWEAVCNGSPCGSDPLTDPLMIWNLEQPLNQNDATIDGIELSVQHWFGESGFGFQANYTMVDSDLEYDDTSTTEQFAMIGLSDTANLVGFYDKHGFQARLAYNWRDTFLSSTTQGGNNQPGYTQDYGQLDFSLGYEVSDTVSLTFEGINVTGEDYRVYGRSERQMFNFEDYGARYAAGVRVTF